MLIRDLAKTTEDGCTRVSCQLSFEGDNRFFSGQTSETLWFEWPDSADAASTPTYDPFAVAALTIATGSGEPMRIDGAVSNELYLNLVEAVSVYHWYFPKLSKIVEIEAAVESRPRAMTSRVGSFFSGGVDSLFSIADLRRLHRSTGCKTVTDLWLVHGMDVALDDVDLWRDVYRRTLDTAAGIGTQLVPIRTNIKTLQMGFAPWTATGFSVIMGAVSKLFASEVPCALIGSYDKYEFSVPHASSPLVDPLWSCDSQNVRHYSASVSRMDKLKVIRDHAPELLEQLRVCWRNPAGSYNCGRCEKCLRTQAQLEVAGCRSLVKSFPEIELAESLSTLDLSLPELQNRYTWRFWEEIKAEAQSAGVPEISRAVSRMLLRNKASYPMKAVINEVERRPRVQRLLGLGRR